AGLVAVGGGRCGKPARQGRAGRAGSRTPGRRPSAAAVDHVLISGGAGRLPGPRGTAEGGGPGGGHRVPDRRPEPTLLAVAVAVPRRAPDAVQVPAQVAEYLLAEPVAIAGGFGRAVLVAVAFDAQGVHARVAGVVDADVDAVPGGADPWRKAVSPRADD